MNIPDYTRCLFLYIAEGCYIPAAKYSFRKSIYSSISKAEEQTLRNYIKNFK